MHCLATNKIPVGLDDQVPPLWLVLRLEVLHVPRLQPLQQLRHLVVSQQRPLSWRVPSFKRRWKRRNFLVGGFNPIEKYARQIGSFPQSSGWKFQKCLKSPGLDGILVDVLSTKSSYSCDENISLHGSETNIPSGFLRIIFPMKSSGIWFTQRWKKFTC